MVNIFFVNEWKITRDVEEPSDTVTGCGVSNRSERRQRLVGKLLQFVRMKVLLNCMKAEMVTDTHTHKQKQSYIHTQNSRIC